MKIILIILIILVIQSCTKPKTVLICGDHACVNNDEAQQYFEENLSLEVKIIDKKSKKEIDLVELNLKNESNNIKKISIKQIKITNKEVNILSNNEIKKIKKEINKKKIKKQAKKQKNIKNIKKLSKKTQEKKKISSKKFSNKDINNSNNNTNIKKRVNKRNNDVADVCTIIKNCSIDEISKFLLDQGRKKKFPDITIKE